MRGSPRHAKDSQMSSDYSIEISNVSKIFPIYDKPHFRLLQMVVPPNYEGKYRREFTALNNVTFRVNRGETLGIVGRNGSGKSTLLQLICGTLTPSSGEVITHGRSAALLELGAGFNPEFTGMENIYLNGSLLGFTKEELDRKLPEILEFADIGDFVHQAVKSYSSGMYVRLAFAVAISLDPDILVVDEALSVGDEAFQRKCFARIESIKQSGATILFVSHSASTVIDLCDRAVLLEKGQMLMEGEPKQVVASYQRMLYAPPEKVAEIREALLAGQLLSAGRDSAVADAAESRIEQQTDLADFDPHLQSQSIIHYETRGVNIRDIKIETLDGRQVNILQPGSRYVYRYRAEFEQSATRVRFGMMIKSLTGIELGGSSTSTPANTIPYVGAGEGFEVAFQFDCQLTAGTYFLNAGVMGDEDGFETFLARQLDAVMFRVLSPPKGTATGLVDFKIQSGFQQ